MQLLAQEVERRRDCCYDIVDLLSEALGQEQQKVLETAGIDFQEYSESEGIKLLGLVIPPKRGFQDDEDENEEESSEEE